MQYAEETEKEIKIVQGENSDQLIEIYSLYSFVGMQMGKPQMVLINQRKASAVCEKNYGANSQ